MEKKKINELIKNNLQHMIKLNPNYSDLYFFKSIFYFSQNQREKAFESLQKSLSINPDYIHAFIFQEYLNFLNHRTCISPSLILQRIFSFPKNLPLETRLFGAMYMILLGDYESSKLLLSSLPSSLNHHSWVVFFHRMNQLAPQNSNSCKLKKTIHHFSSLIHIDPKTTDPPSCIHSIIHHYHYLMLYCFIIQYHLSLIDMKKVRSLLKTAAKSFTDCYAYYRTCADIALMEGNKEEAKQNLLKANEIDPFRAHPAISLSFLYGEKGDLKNSINILQKSLKFNPMYPDLHLYAGETYRVLGKYPKAEFHLKRSLQLNPHYMVSLYNLADLYERKKQFDISLSYYIQALSSARTVHDPIMHKIQQNYLKSSFFGKKSLLHVLNDHESLFEYNLFKEIISKIEKIMN